MIPMMNNTEADVRTDTLIRVMALFFVAIIVLALTTNPIPSGTGVGERAPPLEGKAYNGSAWVDFDMESYLTANWTAGDSNGQWLLVEFMDTDCPFCVRSAGEMGQNANYFMKLDKDSDGTPAWKGPVVNFVASATQLEKETRKQEDKSTHSTTCTYRRRGTTLHKERQEGKDKKTRTQEHSTTCT